MCCLRSCLSSLFYPPQDQRMDTVVERYVIFVSVQRTFTFVRNVSCFSQQRMYVSAHDVTCISRQPVNTPHRPVYATIFIPPPPRFAGIRDAFFLQPYVRSSLLFWPVYCLSYLPRLFWKINQSDRPIDQSDDAAATPDVCGRSQWRLRSGSNILTERKTQNTGEPATRT